MKNDLNGLTLPTCEIMVNGQNRYLYGKKKNKVYLYHGDTFQLNVFNPLQERIGVSLKINGTNADDDLLVINPGQSIIIERYIGTNRKLTFSAYDIDTTNMSEEKIIIAKKAIEKNGILEVMFWNEKTLPPSTTTVTHTNFFDMIYTTNIPIPKNDLFINTQSAGIQGTETGTSITTSNSMNYCFTEPPSTSTKNGVQGVQGLDGIATAGYDNSLKDISRRSICGNTQIEPNKIETGRIEKGEVSNQYFTRIDFEIGELFYKIKFKLLPFSLKPVKKKLYNSTTIKQIVEGTQTAYKSESAVREYCKCGYRTSRGKGVWKNCPMCGRKIK